MVCILRLIHSPLAYVQSLFSSSFLLCHFALPWLIILLPSFSLSHLPSHLQSLLFCLHSLSLCLPPSLLPLSHSCSPSLFVLTSLLLYHFPSLFLSCLTISHLPSSLPQHFPCPTSLPFPFLLPSLFLSPPLPLPCS